MSYPRGSCSAVTSSTSNRQLSWAAYCRRLAAMTWRAMSCGSQGSSTGERRFGGCACRKEHQHIIFGEAVCISPGPGIESRAARLPRSPVLAASRPCHHMAHRSSSGRAACGLRAEAEGGCGLSAQGWNQSHCHFQQFPMHALRTVEAQANEGSVHNLQGARSRRRQRDLRACRLRCKHRQEHAQLRTRAWHPATHIDRFPRTRLEDLKAWPKRPHLLLRDSLAPPTAP